MNFLDFVENRRKIWPEASNPLQSMVIRVVEFSRRGTKPEIFLPKNQNTQMKLLNFENWCSVKVSKSAKI